MGDQKIGKRESIQSEGTTLNRITINLPDYNVT